MPELEKLKSSIEAERFKHHAKSESYVHGTWILIENEDGDHAWELTAKVETSKIESLSDGIESLGRFVFLFQFDRNEKLNAGK